MESENLFACRKSGKAPERSNFAQTCSLLSQYLKEKGSFGDLSTEVAKKLEAAKGKSEMVKPPVTTMDLLPNMEKTSEESSKQRSDASPTVDVKSTDMILPKFDGFGTSESVEEEAIGKAETAQMTMFYAGQVLVFNDFPAEKAKEIMLLASTGSSHTFSGFNPGPGFNKVDPSRSVASSSKIVPATTPTTNPTTQDHVQGHVQPQTNGSGFPIMRRTSLNKFFERRKDRVTAKAPYQLNNPSSLPKQGTSNSWLDLEAQTSNQLELKL